MYIEKTKLVVTQIAKGTFFLMIVFFQLIGTVNAQSWATEEYVQKKRIEIEGRIRDYGRMLVSGDDRDWKHLKESYLKQLPSITSDDEYNSVMDRLVKQEWSSIRLNSAKVDCDHIPNLRCETFIYKLLAGAIAPYVNEGKTWRVTQEFHLAKLQEQEDEKNRRAVLMEELRKEKAEWEIKEKERIARNEEFEAKSRTEREAKEKAEAAAKEAKEKAEASARANARKSQRDAVIKSAIGTAKTDAQKKFMEFVVTDFWEIVDKRYWALNVNSTELKFNELEYRRGKPSTINLHLVATNTQIGLAHGDPLARIAVQSCLNWAIEQGFDPKSDGIYVSVFVYNPLEEKSPTGRNQNQVWGRATYNSSIDRIEWAPWGSSWIERLF